MQTYEVLERALALIEPEENWCQGVRYKRGGKAVCSIGALTKVLHGVAMRSTADYAYGEEFGLDAIALSLDPFLLPKELAPTAAFNDTHTHAEVCDLFRKAIRKAKQDAGVPLEVPEPVAESEVV